MLIRMALYPTLRAAVSALLVLGSGACLHAQASDVLAASGFARDPIGRSPSRPWIASTPAPMSGVVRDALPGASERAWVKLVDGSTELSTNLRHPLPNVTEGILRFKIVNARPGGGLGFYLGTGSGASASDRVFELKISGSGAVSIGGGGERANAGFKLDPGVEYDLYLEFGPEENGTGSLAFGYIVNGVPTTVATAEVASAQPCTVLRITSDKSNADTMFFFADVAVEVP